MVEAGWRAGWAGWRLVCKNSRRIKKKARVDSRGFQSCIVHKESQISVMIYYRASIDCMYSVKSKICTCT